MKKKINFKKLLIYYIIFGVAIIMPATFCGPYDDGTAAEDRSQSYNSTTGSPDWDGVVSSSYYPYGYRVYIADEKGTVVSHGASTLITNLMNKNDSSFTYLSGGGNATTRKITGSASSGHSIPSNLIKFGVFNFSNIMAGQEQNFDSILIKEWDLREVGSTSTKTMYYFHDAKNESGKRSIDDIVILLNNYGDKTGLIGLGDELYDRIVRKKDGKEYFLVAEPMAGMCNNNGTKKCVIGTATELLYWAGGKDGTSGPDVTSPMPKGQNKTFLCRLFNSHVLTDPAGGAGYSYFKYEGTDWQDYCRGDFYNKKWNDAILSYSSPFFEYILRKDSRVGTKSYGLSTDVWALNELFTNTPDTPDSTDCNATPIQLCDKTSKYFKKGCCTCTVAMTAIKSAASKGQYDEIVKYIKNKGYSAFPTSCKVKDRKDNPPPTCTYEIHFDNDNDNSKTSLPKVCSSTKVTSGTVDDYNTWECVFKSTSSTDSNVKTEYRKDINNYCSAYCMEKVSYSLPSGTTTSRPGRYLIVGSTSSLYTIGPVTFSSTKECALTNKAGTAPQIDYTAWERDMNTANKNVEEAWERYQISLLQQDVYNETTRNMNNGNRREVGKGHHTCSLTNNTTCKSGVAWGIQSNGQRFGPYTHQNVDDGWACGPNGHGAAKPKECHFECTGGYNTVPKPANECGDGNFEHDGHESYTIYETSASRVYEGGIYYKKQTISDTYTFGRCGTQNHEDRHTVSIDTGAWANYQNAIKKRKSLLEQIQECNNYANVNGDFKPEVKISYNDVQYHGTYSLEATPYVNSSTTYNNGTYANNLSNEEKHSNRGETSNYTSWYGEAPENDRRATLDVTGMTYPRNNTYVSTTTVTYTYGLQSSLYQYIVKPDGKSQSNKPTSPTSGNDYNNYTYVAFSNLPIHFSTPEGKYGYYLEVSGFGTNDNLNKYLFGNQSFDGKKYYIGSQYRYDCSYIIDPPCIDCPITKKKFIEYRTISLTNPFPGESGAGRNPGTNWYGIDQIDVNKTKVEKYITYNRGVNTTAGTKGATNTAYDVYKLDPMYEIDLTPALMKTIKKYNSERNMKQKTVYGKTSIQGFSDFTLKCKVDSNAGNYKQCTSQVIRSWGVKGCGIGEGKTATKCGTTVAWRMNS